MHPWLSDAFSHEHSTSRSQRVALRSRLQLPSCALPTDPTHCGDTEMYVRGGTCARRNQHGRRSRCALQYFGIDIFFHLGAVCDWRESQATSGCAISRAPGGGATADSGGCAPDCASGCWRSGKRSGSPRPRRHRRAAEARRCGRPAGGGLWPSPRRGPGR